MQKDFSIIHIFAVDSQKKIMRIITTRTSNELLQSDITSAQKIKQLLS